MDQTPIGQKSPSALAWEEEQARAREGGVSHEERLAQARAEHEEKIRQHEELAERRKAEALAVIERRKEEFRARAAKLEGNPDKVLSTHISLLGDIFLNAAAELAVADREEKAVKLYSAIALRAQNYCRMTISSLMRVKELYSTTRDSKNSPDRGSSYNDFTPGASDEAMDRGNATQTGGVDSQLAAVENGHPQNP